MTGARREAARAREPDMGAAMLPSSHGRPAGEGDVPRTRRREATAGRAAVAARAPRRGAAMAQDEYDSGGECGPL